MANEMKVRCLRIGESERWYQIEFEGNKNSLTPFAHNGLDVVFSHCQQCVSATPRTRVLL